MTIDCSKKPLAESIAIIKKINQTRITENLKNIFGTKEKITENLKEIFGEKLTEKAFGNEDMLKGPEDYLRRVLTDFNGSGVKLMSGDTINNTTGNPIDVEGSVKDIFGTELPMKGRNRDYKPVADKFTTLTGLKWTDIDKSVYSGKGGNGGISLRSLSDWSQDAQEAILIQLLAGRISLSDIAATSRYLNNVLDLKNSGSITDEGANIFLKGWQNTFEKAALAKDEFVGVVESLGFDIDNCTVIHQAIKNEYTQIAKLILNNKTAATYDKADAYIMANDAAERSKTLKTSTFRNVTDNNSFLAVYENIRKKADPSYPAITRMLVDAGILLGVSLKKIVSDQVIIEYNPQIDADTFTGEVIVCESTPKLEVKGGKYFRNLKSSIYVNFPVKPGALKDGGEFLTLCVRPNGGKQIVKTEKGTIEKDGKTIEIEINITSGSNRIEWRSCKKLNSLNEVAFGSGTDVIKELYGKDFSSYLNSGSESAYRDATNYLLKDILGMEGDVIFNKDKDNPVSQTFPNIDALTELFCRISGFSTDSSVTAVYLKVY